MRQPIYLLFIAVLLSSCSERLYYPDRANVPAFREAHEIKAVVSVKPQDNAVGPAVSPAADLAYAPINHLGIIASYRTIVNRDGYLYPVFDKPDNYSYNNTPVNIYGHRIEGGAGYFTGFGRMGIFEAYGGYGNGVVDGTSKFTSRYNRFFVQPEAGVRSRIFSAMGGIRVTMEKFYGFESGDPALLSEINSERYGPYVDLTAQRFFFVEPFVNFEVGYKYVAFNAQLGFSAQVDHNPAITGDFPVYASFGAVFHFAPSFLHDEKKKRHHL